MRELLLRCPDCHALLQSTSEPRPRCAGCGREYVRAGQVLDLWPTCEPLNDEDRRWLAHFDRTLAEHGAKDPLAVAYESRRTFTERQRAMTELVGADAGRLLLDVGCGNGLMAQPWRTGNQVVGVDASLEMAHAAAQNGLEAVHAPAFELPFPDGTFDGATLVEVLQHVSDPHRVVGELVRVVRPGGFVALCTHNAESVVRRFLYRFFPEEGPAHKMYTLPQLMGWLAALGCGRFDARHLFLPMPYRRRAAGLPFPLFATTLALRAEKLR